MSPFTDAMGFINGQQIDLKILEQAEVSGEHEPFRRHVEQAVVTLMQPSQPRLRFLRIQGSIQERGGNAIGPESIHLIFH